MISLVTMALGKLFGMGETWVEAKQERETAKVKNTIAREKSKTDASITKEQKDADACNDIDLITIKNQRFTWTDEYFKVVFTLPFILMFIPPLQPYIISGFEGFDNSTPEWYKYIIYGIAISELGMRRIFMKLFDTMTTLRTGIK
tara:strand:+ start:81 stop:515 length:435 start_codon:yes stop_codon:yes gene_type:complete